MPKSSKAPKVSLVQQDLDHLKHPERWANWPFQTMKKRRPEGGCPDAGIAFDDAGADPLNGCVICLVNLFELPLPPEEFDKREKVKFKSWEEALAAGWEVD